jgi:hypothetical protein
MFGMENSNSVPTPITEPLSKDDCPSTNEEKLEMNNIPYRKAVGCLMYLVQGTRPDLAYSIHQVSRFLHNPGKKHWDAVKRILRYVKGTKNLALTFKKQDTEDKLLGYSDADFGHESNKRKSITGWVFTYNGTPISWSSKQQTITAQSTTEAETIALSDATKEALWLRNVINEITQQPLGPTPIFCDNESTLHIVRNREYRPRTKHLDIRHYFARENEELKRISTKSINTKDNVADILTKPLLGPTVQTHRNKLQLFPLTPTNSTPQQSDAEEIAKSKVLHVVGRILAKGEEKGEW